MKRRPIEKNDWSRSLTQYEKRLNDKSIFWSKKKCFIIKKDTLKVSHKVLDLHKKVKNAKHGCYIS